MHRGDNYADQSRAVHVMDRPKQVRRVLGFSFSADGLGEVGIPISLSRAEDDEILPYP